MLILMALPFASVCPLLPGMVALAQLLLDRPSFALSSLLGNFHVAELSPLVVVRSSALLRCAPLPFKSPSCSCSIYCQASTNWTVLVELLILAFFRLSVLKHFLGAMQGKGQVPTEDGLPHWWSTAGSSVNNFLPCGEVTLADSIKQLKPWFQPLSVSLLWC